MSNHTIPWKPTTYSGTEFRSRLEARWAIFWDYLEVPWSYEPRTFKTPDGGYIPDFLVRPKGRRPFWKEVKGPEPMERDYARAEYVETSTRIKFRFFVGNIPESLEAGNLPSTVVRVFSSGKWRPAVWKSGIDGDALQDALSVARSASVDDFDEMTPGRVVSDRWGSQPF